MKEDEFSSDRCHLTPVFGWMVIVLTIAYGFNYLKSENEVEYKAGNVLTIVGIIFGFIAALLKIISKNYL